MSIKFESPEIVPALLFQFEGEYELLRNGFNECQSGESYSLENYTVSNQDFRFETVEVSQIRLSGCMQVGQMINIPLSTSSLDQR